MSARWLEMILILRSQIWVQYNLRLTAVISSTTSTSSSSNVITELAVGAARLDGAERGECLMKGQMEQDTAAPTTWRRRPWPPTWRMEESARLAAAATLMHN